MPTLAPRRMINRLAEASVRDSPAEPVLPADACQAVVRGVGNPCVCGPGGCLL
jgi:hypothetical protein